MSGTKCWHFKFWLFSLGNKPFRSFNISTKDLKGFISSHREDLKCNQRVNTEKGIPFFWMVPATA
jgi:hypothetical protein